MERVSECVQCGRCSAGCPVAFESDHSPRQIIRLLQLNLRREAYRNPFLWFCATCQACSTRCPRGLPVLDIMLALRREGEEQGEAKAPAFYHAFLQMSERRGRISEWQLGLKAAWHQFPRHPLADALLFLRLLRRGKIR